MSTIGIIGISAGVFTITIFILVAMLTYAESKLVTKDLAKLVKERISNNFPLPLKEEKFNENEKA